MLRRNIAATSLKIPCKNPYSVKRYYKTNMEIVALSLWESFSWGLTYFDEFINIHALMNKNQNFINKKNIVLLMGGFAIVVILVPRRLEKHTESIQV